MLTPRDEADLAEAIRAATAPLTVRGGATRRPARAGLSTAGFAGVRLYEPGALTLVAGAATPMAEVESLLAASGQRLGFEPMDHRRLMGTTGTPTLGGAIAMNASGPRRVAVGAARDAVLGVRAVDGTGMMWKNGGRVMKNVTGYDLSRLMTGARGRLGILTEVSLRVQTTPEAEATLRIPASDAAAAVGVMSAALTSNTEVSGAAWDGSAVWLRLEGFGPSVTARLDRLFAITGGETAPCDWAAIRDVADFAPAPDNDTRSAALDAGGQGASCGAAVWRIHLRPSHAPAAAQAIAAIGGEVRLDLGGALIWARLPDGSDLPAALPVPARCHLMRGTGPQTPPNPIEAALIARFDPRNLLEA